MSPYISVSRWWGIVTCQASRARRSLGMAARSGHSHAPSWTVSASSAGLNGAGPIAAQQSHVKRIAISALVEIVLAQPALVLEAHFLIAADGARVVGKYAQEH